MRPDRRTVVTLLVLLSALSAGAQTPAPAAQPPLPAVDVKAADIKAFINNLPTNAISDLPIRVADVGGYRVGVFGVFRPQTVKAGRRPARDDHDRGVLHAGGRGNARHGRHARRSETRASHDHHCQGFAYRWWSEPPGHARRRRHHTGAHAALVERAGRRHQVHDHSTRSFRTNAAEVKL